MLSGCFQNPTGKLLLTGSQHRGKIGGQNYKKMINLKEECIDKCRLHGYSLAGFQYEDDCFCGDESLEDLIDFKVADQNCDWKWGQKMDVEPDIDNITLFIHHTGSLPNENSPMRRDNTSNISMIRL